jgi:inhibitor of KinA sporulation pathway (predicted exonuclease)
MYTVLDFEFNQAFDFEDEAVAVNPKCRFEIIQIGAVKVDKNFKITDSFDRLIKPQIYPRMHPYVQKITGWTNDSFKNEEDFPQVYKAFRDFIGEDKILCTWGSSDINALYRNLTYHKLVHTPVIIEYMDLQNIVTKKLHYSRGGTIGLKNAVELLGIKEEQQFHNALCDAIYTAKVFEAVAPDKPEIKIFNSAHIKKH